eukprot:6747131-Lingulodinium_polyedra.AAC.1
MELACLASVATARGLAAVPSCSDAASALLDPALLAEHLGKSGYCSTLVSPALPSLAPWGRRTPCDALCPRIVNSMCLALLLDLALRVPWCRAPCLPRDA